MSSFLPPLSPSTLLAFSVFSCYCINRPWASLVSLSCIFSSSQSSFCSISFPSSSYSPPPGIFFLCVLCLLDLTDVHPATHFFFFLLLHDSHACVMSAGGNYATSHLFSSSYHLLLALLNSPCSPLLHFPLSISVCLPSPCLF